MGRDGMGSPPGGSDPWRAYRDEFGRFVADTGSSRIVRQFVGAGTAPTKRKIAVPVLGSRSGELTVTGYKVGARGGLVSLVVQCSCATMEHTVDPHNFAYGKTTRCNSCAKKKAGYWKKKFYGYIDVLPDEAHRVRLLNRISACLIRCHGPKKNKHYGGRGIRVYYPWRSDRKAFLAYLITLPGWDRPELEMDRLDTDGHYEPGNIKFSTRSENMANQRQVGPLQERIDRLEMELDELQRENADLRYRLERRE